MGEASVIAGWPDANAKRAGRPQMQTSAQTVIAHRLLPESRMARQLGPAERLIGRSQAAWPSQRPAPASQTNARPADKIGSRPPRLAPLGPRPALFPSFLPSFLPPARLAARSATQQLTPPVGRTAAAARLALAHLRRPLCFATFRFRAAAKCGAPLSLPLGRRRASKGTDSLLGRRVPLVWLTSVG